MSRENRWSKVGQKIGQRRQQRQHIIIIIIIIIIIVTILHDIKKS